MRRMPISRQIDTIVESMMFMVTMSMAPLPQRRVLMVGCTIGSWK